MKKYKNFHIIHHPLIEHKLTIIRDESTDHKTFRELVTEVTTLMTFECTKDFLTSSKVIQTPMSETIGNFISGNDVVIVPILRAGLGMINGLNQLIPNARVGYIGMERDEMTHKPVHYYFKVPDRSEKRTFIILDPMLATGGTATAAASSLKNLGAENIKFMCLIAAPEGRDRFCETHPDIKVYTASLDKRLDENQYIIPGLGDAGDRLFGTE